jgi:hypothetical protein
MLGNNDRPSQAKNGEIYYDNFPATNGDISFAL